MIAGLDWPKGLLLAQVAATWTMVGVIWIVQVVHYPLFAKVGVDAFSDYERDHQRLITLIVAPAMLIEALTAVALVFERPHGVTPGLAWIGVSLVLVNWLSTALLQVPQHTALASGFELRAHRLLVTTNWIRTAAWTLRGLLVLLMLARVMTSTTSVTR